MVTLMPRRPFSIILIGFGDPLGAYFGHKFAIFCDLGWRAGGKFPGPWFWCSTDGNDVRMQ